MPKVIISIVSLLILYLSVPPAGVAQDDGPQMQVLQPRDDTYPGLSPDGRFVAYSSGLGFDKDIVVMERSTGTVRRLTDGPSEDSAPAWSPDGERIVFQREDSTGNRDVWIVDVFEGAETNLTSTSIFREQHPRFSPDGKLVVFDSNRAAGLEDPVSGRESYEIFQIDLAAGEVEQLTEWHDWDMYPSLNAQGTHLVWRRAFDLPDGERNFEIMVKELATGETINISNHPAYDTNPHWSPSGSWIVFVSNRNGYSNLYVVEPDGSNLVMLTNQASDGLAFSRPTFSYDGRQIVANRSVQDVTDIVLFTLQ